MSKLGIKVLIIDYEPRSIKQLSDPLESAGYDVLVAKNGVDGIAMFDREKPDLAMIEAMLPKRHGFEVCQELKGTAHGAGTPIVIVTSVYKGRKYRTQAVHHYGADDYLEKPVDSKTLLSTVQRLLDKQKLSGAATAPSRAAAAATVDNAEAEILDRVDDLLGGGGSGSAG